MEKIYRPKKVEQINDYLLIDTSNWLGKELN